MKDKRYRNYMIKVYSVLLVFIVLLFMAPVIVRFTDVDPTLVYLTIGIPCSTYMVLTLFLGVRGMNKYSWQGPFHDGEKALEKREFAEALACFQRALQLNDEKHELWYSYGLTLFLLKRHEEALKAYENARSLNDKRKKSLDKNLTASSIVIEVAHSYRALGDFQKALDSIMECIEWSPRDDGIYRSIALFHADLGQYQKAIEAAEKSLQLSKRGWIAFSDQVIAHLKLGELEQARELMEDGIEIDLYIARSRYNMALFYDVVELKGKELKSFKKSLQVDGNFTESKELKEKLANNELMK